MKSTIISWDGSNVHSWLFSYVALCCLFITASISSITRPYWSKAEVLPLHCKYLIVVEIRIIVAFSNFLLQKHDTIHHQFTLSCLCVQFDQFKQWLTYYQSCFKCNISFLALLWDRLKVLWDLKILWELASRWAKFCEIMSHNVRYGMYAVSADDWCNKVWVHPNFTQYGSQFGIHETASSHLQPCPPQLWNSGENPSQPCMVGTSKYIRPNFPDFICITIMHLFWQDLGLDLCMPFLSG